MSKFLNYTLLSILITLGFTQTAFAKTISCERTRFESSGFTTAAAAASWMPEYIDINIRKDNSVLRVVKPNGLKPILYRYGKVLKNTAEGRVSIEYKQKNINGQYKVKFEKFIGNKATLGLVNRASFISTDPSRYKCEIKKP